jgi:hypothetical protein
VTRVGRVPGMPVHCLVNIRQLKRWIQRSNVCRFGKSFSGALKDKAYELRSLNQKGNKKKAFYGDVDPPLNASWARCWSARFSWRSIPIP